MKEEAVMRIRRAVTALFRPPAGRGGFSMTELIVALAIAAIAAVGIYSVYISQQKASTSQRLQNDLQNDLRFAMDYMKNELFLAGFGAVDDLQPVSQALANTITFEYRDENHTPSDVAYGQNIQVTYSLAGNNLTRTVYEYNTGTTNFDILASQVLSKNVTALAFSYRTSDDQAYVIGTNTPDEIRTVRISLTGRSRRADPFTGQTRSLTLTGEVKSRNLAIASNPLDETPPAVPTGLASVDPEECGRLDLRWNANSDVDLAGYVLYYGLSSGSYSGRVRMSRSPGTGYVTYTLGGLGAVGSPYYIAISAYDRSGNHSDLSAEIFGDPVYPDPPGNTQDWSVTDTSVDPVPPAQPGDFTVAPGENEGELQLTWTEPADTYGVTGYRVYRFKRDDPNEVETDAVNVPTDSEWESDGELIANEAELGPGTTGYLDTGLVGCNRYYYRVYALHCDPSAFSLSNPDYAYAAGYGAPDDSAPTTVPNLFARSGFRRILLSLDNPVVGTDPDFSHSLIYYNKSATVDGAENYPVLLGDGTIDNGTGLPDFTDSGVLGRTETKGPVATIFDSHTEATPVNPSLDIDQTYYFLAVAYDYCGNANTGASASASAEQCGDCTEGVCAGFPPAPDWGEAGEDCAGTVQLSWHQLDTSPTAHFDLAGYRIFRQTGTSWDDSPAGLAAAEELQTIPWWFNSYNDVNVVEGEVYSYLIVPTDCAYENGNFAKPWFDPRFNDGDPHAITIEGVYSGRLERVSQNSTLFTPMTMPMGIADTDVYVVDASNFCTNAISIEGEVMTYDWRGPDYFGGLTRGVLGAPTAHPATPGDPLPGVFSSPPALESQAVSGGETATTYRHNQITFWLRNTASGPLVITGMRFTWLNPLAFLQRIEIGPGVSTPEDTLGNPSWSDGSLPLSQGTTNSPITLDNPKTIYPLDDFVPVTLTFRKQDGTVDENIDMRQNLVDFEIISGKAFDLPLGTDIDSLTEADLDSTCSLVDDFFVGQGPVIQNVTQSAPTWATPSWPVPGNTGTNVMDRITIDGWQDVWVLVTIKAPSFACFDEVNLHYYADVGSVFPNAPEDGPTSPYTVIPMMNWWSNVWETSMPIPASPDTSVWYYITVRDLDGNIDRAPDNPEVDGIFHAYQYYQREPDICENIPAPPDFFELDESVPGQVTLRWAPPAMNEFPYDFWAYDDNAGYRVYRGRGGTFTMIAEYDSMTVEHTDTPDMIDTYNYAYYVTTFDTCQPEANESRPSQVRVECQGISPGTCFLRLDTPTGEDYVYAESVQPEGNTFGITLLSCDRQNGTPDEVIYAQVCSLQNGDADPIQLIEQGDTGVFQINPNAFTDTQDTADDYAGRTRVQLYPYDYYPAAAMDLDLRVGVPGAPTPDQIVVTALREPDPTADADVDFDGDGFPDPDLDGSPSYSSSFGGCEAVLPAPVPLPADTCLAGLSVVEDPCMMPLTPAAPTNVQITNLQSCNAQGNTIRLTWDPPGPTLPDGSPAGPVTHYNIYRCTDLGCNPGLLEEGGELDRVATGIVATSHEPLDQLSYDDVIVGEKIAEQGQNPGIFRYVVTAVNATCTDPWAWHPETIIEANTAVEDPCP
jgi:prepilin-type N-terminal cleavage/methylation domain-containing protein